MRIALNTDEIRSALACRSAGAREAPRWPPEPSRVDGRLAIVRLSAVRFRLWFEDARGRELSGVDLRSPDHVRYLHRLLARAAGHPDCDQLPDPGYALSKAYRQGDHLSIHPHRNAPELTEIVRYDGRGHRLARELADEDRVEELLGQFHSAVACERTA